MRDRVYQFKISKWASKVEIYDPADGGQNVAHIIIEEGEMMDMIDEMLTEMEREY